MIADELEANLKATAMDLMEKSKDMGLIINESKTKNMVLSRRTHSQTELVIGPLRFGRVKTFNYLRVDLDTNSGRHDKFNVSQHIRTEKHVKSAKRQKDQVQRKSQLLTNQPTKSDFNKDLCEAMVAANIPFNKFSNTIFRSFLEKYTSKSIPFEATLRKGYIDDIYNQVMDKIKIEIGNNQIWVSVDETCDVQGRCVANVIVGILKPDYVGHSFLLRSEELTKTNHNTICKVFNKAMTILWPGDIMYNNVLLFLSDAAPYMIKAGSVLKNLYTKMIHTTCSAHALHRIAEEIRGQFKTVDELISNMKKIFVKPHTVLLCLNR
ncbi:hypothetical protein QTP88_015573 [Uroleucon formosanum]